MCVVVFMEIFTDSPEATEKLGASFAASVKRGAPICLYGQLGSGKTKFVQGLARKLGCKKNTISPSFVLLRSYRLENKVVKELHHLDLYRLERQSQLKNIGIEDLFNNQEALVVIEWAEKLNKLLPKKRTDVRITIVSEKMRKFNIISFN